MFVCVLGQAEVESHLSLLWLDAVANNINGYIMKQFATFMCSPSAKSVVFKHGGTHPTVHCTDPDVFADFGIPAFGKVSFTETRDSIKIAKVGNVQFYLNIPRHRGLKTNSTRSPPSDFRPPPKKINLPCTCRR